MQLNEITWSMAWMIDGETAVIRRVPVLRGHDDGKMRLQLVRHWRHRIATGHGQRPARHEIVLEINKD
jgi:hypothetical protein